MCIVYKHQDKCKNLLNGNAKLLLFLLNYAKVKYLEIILLNGAWTALIILLFNVLIHTKQKNMLDPYLMNLIMTFIKFGCDFSNGSVGVTVKQGP